MRAETRALATGLVVLLGGCQLLQGYYYKPVHFQFATAGEQEFSQSVNRMVGNVKIVLEQRGISIRDIKREDEAAQIWATKNGLDFVFDIKSVGEGSFVHIEINQAGNHGLVWGLMHDLEMLP